MWLHELAEAPSRRIRAILMAAAVDSDWILPGHYEGAALSQLEQVFITVNYSDRVLKRYHWLYRCSNPRALGWAGPSCPACFGPWLAKLEMGDVSRSVGKKHSFFRYIQSAAVVSRLGWYGFFAEPWPEPSAVEHQLTEHATTPGQARENSLAIAN
jgi:hypothetical protein